MKGRENLRTKQIRMLSEEGCGVKGIKKKKK